MLGHDREKWEPVFPATNAKGVGAEIVLEQDVERDSSKISKIVSSRRRVVTARNPSERPIC